jgi:flagellar hook-associated protein FlgK
MRVVTAGTVGAATGAPLVEFTYYTGPADAPVAQTVQKVLDDTVPAGTPVAIADGVYAVFGAGTLSTAGNQVSFTVDAKSDSDAARLLPALGIDGMLTGSTAATLQVATALKQDPTRLAVGATRAAGDNANVLDLAAVRQDKVFGDGSSTVDDFYQSTLTGLGARIQQTHNLSDNQDTLTTSLENQRQQVSGVSIDEEVSNLILEQQAYTAAARVITMTRENITTLMGMLT